MGRHSDFHLRAGGGARHGLSKEQVRQWRNSADRCAICEEDDRRKFALDHCHWTGKVRGVLCKRCNGALSHFGDKAAGVRRALHYLSPNDDGGRRLMLYVLKLVRLLQRSKPSDFQAARKCRRVFRQLENYAQDDPSLDRHGHAMWLEMVGVIRELARGELKRHKADMDM
jgi:hypothetical protein